MSDPQHRPERPRWPDSLLDGRMPAVLVLFGIAFLGLGLWSLGRVAFAPETIPPPSAVTLRHIDERIGLQQTFPSPNGGDVNVMAELARYNADSRELDRRQQAEVAEGRRQERRLEGPKGAALLAGGVFALVVGLRPLWRRPVGVERGEPVTASPPQLPAVSVPDGGGWS